MPLPGSATTLPVRVTTSLHNKHWFPLSEKEMREAAIDTALEGISGSGLLSFVGTEQADRLDLKVTLVEPAQVAKLTIQLDSAGNPSAVATASTSLEGLDYGGIYYAFEHIGREAAARMNAKLAALAKTLSEKERQAHEMKQAAARKAPPPAADPAPRLPAKEPPSRAKPLSSPSAKGCADESLAKLSSKDLSALPVKSIYQVGQRLKEARCYFDAMVAFQLVANRQEGDAGHFPKLAEQEIAYGLPMFEARQLSLDVSRLIRDKSNTSNDLTAHLNRIEQLYRQVLVENEGDLEHTTTAQRELDQHHHMRRALKESFFASALSDAVNASHVLSMELGERYELPRNGEQIASRFEKVLAPFEILDYRANHQQKEAYLYLRHRRWGFVLELQIDRDFRVHVTPDEVSWPPKASRGERGSGHPGTPTTTGKIDEACLLLVKALKAGSEPVKVLGEAAKSRSPQCVRALAAEMDQPGVVAAEVLSGVGKWTGAESYAPVIKALLATGIDFSDRKSPVHSMLFGLVEQQEPEMLEHALALGAWADVENFEKATPLILAARLGEQKAIELLLKHGADVNHTNKRRKGPLWFAVVEELPSTAELLLAHGADPDARDDYMLTPYLLACKKQKQPMLKLLANASKEAKTLQPFCNYESIAAGEALYHPSNWSLKDVKRILARKPLLDLRPAGGKTALHAAISRGDKEVAGLLLAAGADATTVTWDGETPLHSAVRQGDVPLVGRLLARGASIEVQTQFGETPFSAAKGTEMLSLLVDKGGKPSEHSLTRALFNAIKWDGHDHLAWLLEYGAPLGACGSDEYGVLGWALRWKNRPAYDLLLKRGADIHEPCPGTGNLLVRALQWRGTGGVVAPKGSKEERIGLAMDLIARGADLNRTAGAPTRTPMSKAVSNRDGPIIDLLLERGVDLNVPLSDGYSPLLGAMVLRDGALMRRLLEHGADPNLDSKQRDTPLTLAIKNGMASEAALLLKHGAKANVSDSEGKTALGLAFTNPSLSLRLLQHGASPHTGKGALPLSVALRNYDRGEEWRELFRALLERGALPVRREGVYPLHDAVSRGQCTAAELLIRFGADPAQIDEKGRSVFELAKQSGCSAALVARGEPRLPPVSRPSFDCGKAANYVEKEICSSEKLAVLDVALAEAYQQRLNETAAADRSDFKSDQIAFIRTRNAQCRSATCIEELTRERLARLRGPAGP